MRCPDCGAPNRRTARFCDQCGAMLPARQSDATPSRSGDRRIVTALFADIVDYSRLVSELDAEDVVVRVDEAFASMAAAVDRYGGVVEKFIGDAVFAVFGVHRAHDDDPLRAGLCSLAMGAAFESAARERGEAPLRLRVGIATGEVVTTRRSLAGVSDVSVTGETVVTAIRLQELAEPGEILVDEATQRASRNRFETDVVGERPIRGRAAPVRVHRLRGERLHRLVGSSATGLLVGRSAERAHLQELLVDARRTGRGRVVLIVGDAGIGKSRLAADLEEEARDLGFRWTWTENLSYTTGEYYGFARTFAQHIADEESTDSGSLARRLLFTPDIDEATVHRLSGAIAALARDARFSGWEADAARVPADPAQVRADLGDVTERYLRRLVEALGPRALVVDDLHWMDESSGPLLDRLVRTVADLPVVVFVTSRPGPRPDWAGLDHVEVLELVGLDSRSTERLAAAVAGADLADATTATVYGRTSGNPLFVGETVRALMEDEAFIVRHGRLHLRDPDRVETVPVSLRALLGARIDALPDDARAVLQVASVVGMTFDAGLVARLCGRAAIEGDLAVLAPAAVVTSIDETAGTWRFSHPLIHDVAYSGTLAARRRELHSKLADELETVEPPVLPGVLAQHRAAAGDRVRAVPLLERAADKALLVGATAEAIGYWRAALRLLGDDPAADAIRDRIASVESAEVAEPLVRAPGR
ncbi:MAG: AAA family ATPase [Candidatus Limnocylindrales bacterium]